MRGLTDPEIAKALGEAAAFTVKSKSSMREQFGTPVEYAAQFPKRKHRPLGRKVTTALSVIAAVWAVFSIFSMTLTGTHVELWPAIALLFAGAVGGFLLDYFLPVRPASDEWELPPIG